MTEKHEPVSDKNMIRLISDLGPKRIRLTREEAARLDAAPVVRPSKLTLLFNEFLSDPAQLIHAWSKSSGDALDEIATRKTIGIDPKDGWTTSEDRQSLREGNAELMSDKIEYTKRKQLEEYLPKGMLEHKEVFDPKTGKQYIVHRLSRTIDSFRFLVRHHLNESAYDDFQRQHYFIQCEHHLFAIIRPIIDDIWPAIDKAIWNTINSNPALMSSVHDCIIESTVDIYSLHEFHHDRYEKIKIFLRNEATSYFEKLQQTSVLSDDDIARMTQTLSFLRFVQTTLRVRQHHYAFVSTLKNVPENGNIKKDLDALTTIVLPTIDEIIREYEQTVLAEIQRTTKTQGGKVKKR